MDLPSDVAAMLFRVAQESVRNTQRHADANVLSVRVRLADSSVIMTITDDGRGFDTSRSAPEGHVGLRLLADLAGESGSTLDIRSEPGAGTTVRVEVPL